MAEPVATVLYPLGQAGVSPIDWVAALIKPTGAKQWLKVAANRCSRSTQVTSTDALNGVDRTSSGGIDPRSQLHRPRQETSIVGRGFAALRQPPLVSSTERGSGRSTPRANGVIDTVVAHVARWRAVARPMAKDASPRLPQRPQMWRAEPFSSGRILQSGTPFGRPRWIGMVEGVIAGTTFPQTRRTG